MAIPYYFVIKPLRDIFPTYSEVRTPSNFYSSDLTALVRSYPLPSSNIRLATQGSGRVKRILALLHEY